MPKRTIGSGSVAPGLDIVSTALAAGVLWGAGMFVIGIVSMTGWAAGFVTVMGTAYVGFGSTVVGSVIGGIWGFFDAAAAGALFAWLYNIFESKCRTHGRYRM